MEKRGETGVIRVLISLVLIIIIIHLATHFAIYGTGLPIFGESGISGLSIGPIEVEESSLEGFRDRPGYQNLSKYIVLGEWSLMMILIALNFVKEKLNIREEVIDLSATQIYKRSENHTDLDILYEILKEKKSLRLSTISKLFKIDKELVMEWVATLESGNLASINYPRFGEPEVKIVED